MDLLELDERLEKDIKHLEKSLVEYEKLINEASTLKYTFENQTKELMAAYGEKVVTLFHDFELKKNVFELYVNQMSEANGEKWKEIQVQSENKLSDLEGKVNDKINKLEEENKRSLIKIINDHTVNEKESIEAINTNISMIKSESERSLINLSSELFKETMRAEDKDRKLARNFKIFMAISSVLFIVLLIWR